MTSQIISWRGVLDTTLYDKVCQCLTIGQQFSPGTLVFSTNKTDRHDTSEILLKVTLDTINLNFNSYAYISLWYSFLRSKFIPINKWIIG